MSEKPNSNDWLKQITNSTEQGVHAPFHQERYVNESI